MLGALAVISFMLGQHAAPEAAPPATAPPAQDVAPDETPKLPEAPKAARDSIAVLLPANGASLLQDGANAGRVVLSLVSTDARLGEVDPCAAPFFDAPQPLYSVAVDALVAGKRVEFDARAASFPVPIDQLRGEFRIQAVFNRDTEHGTHLAPGNLLTAVQTVHLDPERVDTVLLEFTERIAAPAIPTLPNFHLFSLKSTLLSEAAGHDVYLRAGVALPQGWNDPNFRRRMWGAMYVIPDVGGDPIDAVRYARMLSSEVGQSVVPQAVWIVLDPDGPWGHHGFVDSAANGPRAKALVQELIPALERQFRLIARTEARMLMGHGAGGWSSLWLQLSFPEMFGACFSTAPTPVDFSAFQMVNLYSDPTFFSDAEGRETPSFRVPIVKQYEKVRMTTRDQAGMEFALSPDGRSGERLDMCNAMWSALDPHTRLPRRAFDPQTGLIDRAMVERDWARYDIARLVVQRPEQVVPILRQRVRLLVGERDNFFLQRAVKKLQAAMESASAAAAAKGAPFPEGAGYIQVLPDETYYTLPGASMLRWHGEIRHYLKANGLD